ncbi:MAG: DNA polymerase III subunit epsilon [Gammaproteobacteria bacterium]|nr:DNA polymerase III subunit epsilon [Gammaproteobacteria bacterium]
MSRQIVLDTETTGLDFKGGHRVIEIGCVEMINRRLTGNNLHLYLQPDREIDPGAMEVHGITNEFLQDKPRFGSISEELENYLLGSELIIHNADFDIGFLDNEFLLAGRELKLRDVCEVTDSLAMARKLYPGQRNNLDALCRRLGVKNSHRTLHGALLDSEILADVYLVMTGGQTDLGLDVEEGLQDDALAPIALDTSGLVVVAATDAELSAHDEWVKRLTEQSPTGCLWLKEVGN